LYNKEHSDNGFFLRAGAFEDENVTHVEGEVNPIRDLEIINEELRLKDEEYLCTHLEKQERTVLRGGDKKLKPEYVSSCSHTGLPYVVYRMLSLVEILSDSLWTLTRVAYDEFHRGNAYTQFTFSSSVIEDGSFACSAFA
jgi:hypothetical protein